MPTRSLRLTVLGALLLTALTPGVAMADRNVISADRVVEVAPESDQRYDKDMIIYTASQEWLSRIYLLTYSGQVLRYFEYEFYRFADLEVVNNEVYAAEAFAPRVLKVDLDTGDLEVIVDDWSLYYFYDLAWDGQYFYLNEWDLNRYELDGSKDGTASADGSFWGGAWDGSYYWTVTDENLIKCWDTSGWPTVTEVPGNAIIPPSPECRGLWYDGQYFWTAESVEGSLGQIYQFDHTGRVVRQVQEPAYQGWGVCVIRHVTGDIDGDADVDLDDFERLFGCLTGPGASTPPPGCTAQQFGRSDLDNDEDIDLDDFRQFAEALAGWDPVP